MAVVGSEQATRQAAFLAEAVVTGETSERASGIQTVVSRGNIVACPVECVCGVESVKCVPKWSRAGWAFSRRGEHDSSHDSTSNYSCGSLIAGAARID